MNLAEQLRNEINNMCDESTKSFLSRKDYVINKIRGGEREVYFFLVKSYDHEDGVSRAILDKLGVNKEYKVNTCKNIDGNGIYYRNGKHYIEVVKRAENYPHTIVDYKEYCIEDIDGAWKCKNLYNREELLDLGAYFENQGFKVYVNRCSDSDSRYHYKTNFYNIQSLIVTL